MKIETKCFTEVNDSAVITVVLDSEAKAKFLLNGFELTIKERPLKQNIYIDSNEI